MNTYTKFLKETEIKPGIYEVTYGVFHSGACQCFKDCDCINKKGQLLGTTTTYRNDKVLKWNGKPRNYTSLKDCENSLASWYKKKQ